MGEIKRVIRRVDLEPIPDDIPVPEIVPEPVTAPERETEPA